ncbi:peptidase M20 [Kaistia sp. 32K]|uniref:M20 family metallopeptidase n=1 Tax=Kaistia sp. 32K TaxID=2795690 RepID=UPI0019153E39|nr:M20 family metallopeptidase [Kaistia sp. 32K]BCP55246.1 peptidase M20 [Kaistia sp. 32K]
MKSLENSDPIWGLVEEKRAVFTTLSDEIWEMPELNYREYRSSASHARVLEEQGFRVTRGAAGLPTALVAEAGHGGPVIAFLGEFDALPGLSQAAGVAEHHPLQAGGNGHGCGHNLLGSGALQAATAVKDYLERHGLEGRVRYYGCPAEESGSGKGFMVRSGAFDDVDAAIAWHPAAFTGVSNPVSLACCEVNFHFVGRSSHAASAPHLGRSALDAVELMNVGANYMREHMPSRARIHYAIINPGGMAPNVVQGEATVQYVVRGVDCSELHDLLQRVIRISQGAALMTETSVSHVMLAGDPNLLGNVPLEQLMHRQLEWLGPVPFDAADREVAARFQQTVSQDGIRAAFARAGEKLRVGLPLCDSIVPPRSGDAEFVGSTDLGHVSWKVPTVELRCAVYAIGTPGHSWQLVAQGKLPAAHKGMEHAAKVMAASGVELLTNPAALAAAKAEHLRQISETPFIDPMAEVAGPDLPKT